MRPLDVRVNRIPLALVCDFGDVEMTTDWPGGSGELSWSSANMPGRLAKGGATVEGYLGPQRVWYGVLDEPDPSQDRISAQGLYRLADNYPALTAAGAPQSVPDLAIDQAIARGLPWKRVASLQSTSVEIDLSSGPVTLGALLDAMAEGKGTRWGVDATGAVFDKADDTSPAYVSEPLDISLGYALDNYASTLFGRYLSSTAFTYLTTPALTDSAAVALHGYREEVVDLTGRGAISAARATVLLQKLLDLGRAKPQFTESIEFSYGEILTTGGVPVALETVEAGRVLRVLGLEPTRQGPMYVDVPIGHTSLSGGTLTVQPLGIATRSYQDFVTESLSTKK